MIYKSSTFNVFSLKTGYGKYIGVDATGFLVAVADAIGARERFEAVFQDVRFTTLKPCRNLTFQGLCAIQSVSSGLFMSLQTNEEDLIMVCSKTAKEYEIVNVRNNFFI